MFASCSSDDESGSGGGLITPIEQGNDLYGVVTDDKGNRMEGVVVSDGFSVAVTDQNGCYQ